MGASGDSPAGRPFRKRPRRALASAWSSFPHHPLSSKARSRVRGRRGVPFWVSVSFPLPSKPDVGLSAYPAFPPNIPVQPFRLSLSKPYALSHGTPGTGPLHCQGDVGHLCSWEPGDACVAAQPLQQGLSVRNFDRYKKPLPWLCVPNPFVLLCCYFHSTQGCQAAFLRLLLTLLVKCQDTDFAS